LLTEPDDDVIRYHLSHHYTIESLITFAGKLFVGRATDQSKEIHTSSLILVCTKNRPTKRHSVECVNVSETDSDVREVLADLAVQRKKLSHRVFQSDLRKNLDNWNFVTWKSETSKLYRQYRAQSESLAIYSEHRIAKGRFGTEFFFDVGFVLDRNKESMQAGKTKWGVVNFQDFVNFTNFRPSVFYPNDEKHIELPRNSQGYQALYRRHKLLWEKSRKYKFYYTDADVIPSMSYCQIVSSNDRKEILFLFAMLNSSITRYVFEAMYALGNEKVGMFIAVSRLKSLVRPPLVDSAEKKKLKERIIREVGKALDMERKTVAEVVEIDTLARRVSNPRVLGRNLVVTHRGIDL